MTWFKDDSDHATIERLLRLIHRYGTIVGCRLFCTWNPERLSFCFRLLIFLAVLGIYLLAIIAIILTAIPHASETRSFQLDSSTAFAFVWVFLALMGLGCFVTLNFANYVLVQEDGFFRRYEENFSQAMIRKKSMLTLKRVILWTFWYVLFVDVVLTSLAILYTSGFLQSAFPLNIKRATLWLPFPPALIRGIIQLSTVFVTLHASYHALVFTGLCEISWAHFSTFCDRLAMEPVTAFIPPRIGKYQSDYSRLAELVDCLDDAFKHTNFSQLAVYTGTMCFMAFMFVHGGVDPMTVPCILFYCVCVNSSFLYTAVPAISLQAKAEKPKKILRGWFLKYEKSCEQSGVPASEASRQAASSLLQWICAEDVGMTVSSLAKLDAQMLMAVTSVVITYLLVIIQFATPIDLGPLQKYAENSTAFCAQFFSPR